jgi:hypothetical protein
MTSRIAALTLLALLWPIRTGPAQEPADPPRRISLAGTYRSPGVVKRLQVAWRDVVLPAEDPAEAPARTPVKKEQPEPKPRTQLPLSRLLAPLRRVPVAPRPAVVLAFDPTFKFRELLQIQRGLFATEPLIIAAKFFHTLRLRERLDLPAGFYVLDARGRIHGRLPLNAGRKNLKRQLDAVFTTHYAGRLDQAVARYAAWLDRFEQAEDAVAMDRSVAHATALARVQREEAKWLRPPFRKPKDPTPEKKG